MLPYIFDRFRQADSSTTRSYGGLGLGLSIVRYFVEAMNGIVTADSAGIGQGATFTVTLPTIVMPTQADRTNDVAIDAPPASAIALAGIRVLVVDDDMDVCELLSSILEAHGAQTLTVCSAHEALTAVKTWMPSVLISDIGMPEEDGYALIRQVRALDAGQGGQIPAVALTAYARVEERTQALSEGFQLHLSKPFTPQELVSIVTNLAEQSNR